MLHLLEQPNGLLVMAGSSQQGECVVQLVAGGIRSQMHRQLEFPYSFLLGGGVLIIRLTQVATLGEQGFVILAGAGRLQEQRHGDRHLTRRPSPNGPPHGRTHDA